MKIKSRLFYVVILVIATGYFSFAEGNSSKESQKRNLKDFTAIEVSTGIHLFLSMENNESVRIEAPENIINDVITEVKDGTLKLYIKRKSGFNFFNWFNHSTVKAYVSVAELNKLKASSGSHVRSENTLKGNILDINASSGSQLDVDLVYREVVLGASSGSQLNLKGRSKFFKASTSSGSSISAWNLEAENCKANASSGGTLSVHVKDEISAKASSGGNIRYSGNPSVKQVNKSSGGTVSAR
jgi:hypothetical protein